MSTISEIDIRDWEKVDFKTVETLPCDASAHFYWDFIDQVKALRDKQIAQATKHIPAILKKEETK